MKFNLLCAIFIFSNLENGIFAGKTNTQDQEKERKIVRAKLAKTEYNIAREDEGFQRLKNAFPEEKKLSRVLQWVLFEQVCLRRSTDSANSCYAMSDFSIEPSDNWNKYENWLSAPYSKGKDPTLKWYERLYNSIAYMLLTETNKGIILSLGTKSGHGVGQRESIPVKIDIGISDSKTFKKGFITGENLGPQLTINVLDSLEDMKGTINKILKMTEEAYDNYLMKIAI